MAGPLQRRHRPPVLDAGLWFPDPREALDGTYGGLVAIGGDLSVERLLLAYRSGIFPWSEDPITWWSPDPRPCSRNSASSRRRLPRCP
jgi:Leu/Phe-tRNA-protein transferase